MKALFIFIFSLFYFPLCAEIVECQRFGEIHSYIKEGDTLFFEIDNVLLKPKSELSSTLYFNHLKQEMLRQGLEAEEILNTLYPLWIKVQKSSEMEVSDAGLLLDFNALKAQNINMLGLSHRGSDLALYSDDVLQGLGLYFEKTSPFGKNIFFEENLAYFFEGMLYIHPACDKGEYLLKLLERVEYTPERIVCVDYELVNLINIKRALDLKGIPFLGIYYKNQDLNISDYTIQIGNIQLEHLDKILPDPIAKILVEK